MCEQLGKVGLQLFRASCSLATVTCLQEAGKERGRQAQSASRPALCFHACAWLQVFDELLIKAGVHRLCLPAAHETVLTWRQGFNFVDMPEDDVK